MIVWIDAQISPALATWLAEQFSVDAKPLRELGLRDATDREIFFRARAVGAVVVTKDSDFVRLLEQHGPPPRILWLTLGNTTNERLCEVLLRQWARAASLFASGEALVEIQG